MDAFDRLAERLVRGAQEEYVRELTERLASMLVRGVDNPDELALLPRVSREAAMGVWAEHEKSVTGSVREAFEEALSQVSEADAEALSRGEGEPPALTEWAEERVGQAARATAESVRRQNLALAQTEADELYAAVADASARLNLGESRYAVIERAVARLAKAGVETVDYLTGRRTTVDAAVRRIVVTQQNRCRNELLQRRCEEFGHDLVFVSAHFGCRPTHEWFQGQVFSRSGAAGETTASGGAPVRYRPLSSTGYPGDPAGLCGVNCRHTMTPFVEGFTRLPDTEFKSQREHFGMTSAEYYAATQRQRALERRVRAAKREVAVGQAQGLDMVDSRLRLGRAQAELRAWCAANRLTRDPSRERAYGVAEQPRTLGRHARKKHGGVTAFATAFETDGDQRNTDNEQLRKDLARALRTKFPAYAGTRTKSDRDLRANLIMYFNSLGPKRFFYDIGGHGNVHVFKCFDSLITPEQLAWVITNRGDYDGKQPIRLLACYTGHVNQDGTCFAAELSKLLGVRVLAPDGVVYFSDGKIDRELSGHFRWFDPKESSTA